MISRNFERGRLLFEIQLTEKAIGGPRSRSDSSMCSQSVDVPYPRRKNAVPSEGAVIVKVQRRGSTYWYTQ